MTKQPFDPELKTLVIGYPIESGDFACWRIRPAPL
jgi:hypothetical protein